MLKSLDERSCGYEFISATIWFSLKEYRTLFLKDYFLTFVPPLYLLLDLIHFHGFTSPSRSAVAAPAAIILFIPFSAGSCVRHYPLPSPPVDCRALFRSFMPFSMCRQQFLWYICFIALAFLPPIPPCVVPQLLLLVLVLFPLLGPGYGYGLGFGCECECVAGCCSASLPTLHS